MARQMTSEQEFRQGQRVATILIVDDHPLVRRGLRELIDQEPGLEVCGEAASVREAMSLAGELRPDAAIIDISLKDGSGIELIKTIRARFPEIRMLVASMHPDSLFAERALQAGAMGFVNKQETIDTLVHALHQILNNRMFVSGDLADQLLQRAVRGKSPATPEEVSPIARLSDREIEVLELLGRGETTRGIAETLHLSIKTIETYHENIKNKLNLKNSAELRCFAAQWVLGET